MTRTTTIATLFSGGEGVGVGARAAGLRHVWGIESDDRIAQVAQDNSFVVHVADVLEVEPTALEPPCVLHASPPCPNFSQAKQGAEESAEDVALAERVALFVEVLRPEIFTLENVRRYRKSRSWAIIADTLNRCGYWHDVADVNAADFGVPQTRVRMFARALHGRMVPYLPLPEPWVGWWEAIEDLLPGLPSSQLANWQLRGLCLRGNTLIDSAGYPSVDGHRVPVQREADEPANTVVANLGRRPMRVFLVGGQYDRPSSENDRMPQVAWGDEPTFTVTASYKGDWRAFVIDGANASRLPTMRRDDQPIFTIDAMRPSKHPRDICLKNGRIVRLSVRALARLQSFPDDYVLPDNQGLAARVIGNAVPPLLYEKIVRQLIRQE